MATLQVPRSQENFFSPLFERELSAGKEGSDTSDEKVDETAWKRLELAVHAMRPLKFEFISTCTVTLRTIHPMPRRMTSCPGAAL